MNEPFLAGSGALWVQPEGAGTKMYYLGCHEISSLSYSRGDANLVFSPGTTEPNTFQPVQLYRSEPSAATVSIKTYVRSMLDWLEALDSVFNLYVAEVVSGRKDTFDNYERVWVLRDAIVGPIDRDNLAIISPGDQKPSEQEVEITATDMYTLTKIDVLTQVTRDLDTVSVCFDLIGPEKTYAAATSKLRVYKYVYAAYDDGKVRLSKDGGNTWVAYGNPIPTIGSLVTVQLNPSEHAILVARASYAANTNAISRALSGLTWATVVWTAISVGETGMYGSTHTGESLFASSSEIIWFMSMTGDLFKSVDSGESFTKIGDFEASESIKFLNQNVGFFSCVDNKIYRTLDGGTTWVSFTGSADEVGNQIISIQPITKEKIWITYLNGHVYSCNSVESEDWKAASFATIPTTIHSITFYGELLGFLSAENSSGDPIIYRTVNGGYSWEIVPVLSGTTSCSHIKMVNPNLAYVASTIES